MQGRQRYPARLTSDERIALALYRSAPAVTRAIVNDTLSRAFLESGPTCPLYQFDKVLHGLHMRLRTRSLIAFHKRAIVTILAPGGGR